jgi:hypothetical protein
MTDTKRPQITGRVNGSLRDRIAAALRNVRGELTYEALADAVIRELGLRKQSQTGEIVNLIEGDGINYGRHRYVTEWEPDE